MPNYFLRIEAVNLDNSVYDTNDISTIRGGSFMLLNAVNQFKEINGTLLEDIGSAASIGFYKFEAKDDTVAERIRKKALDILQAKDGEFATESFATYVSAWKQAGAPKDFYKDIQCVTAKCHWQQYQQPTLVLPNELPDELLNNQECSFDGVRPAIATITKGQETKSASKAVKKRYDEGVKLRDKLYKKLTGVKDSFTKDIEDLATRNGTLNGKIAFIHFDGNRFGLIRDQLCRSEENYTKFQNKAQKSREDALKNVISIARKKENRTMEGLVRLETPLWGGDEIEFVVPAWQAINLLNIFFNEIQEAEKFQNVPLTYSAGVLFCHHNLPILQVRRYAEQLCNLAKEDMPKDIYELDAKRHNRFAFLDMSAFDLVKGDIRRFMAEYHAPADSKDFVILASELNSIKENLLDIKCIFPKNKLYDIIQALKTNRNDEIGKIRERVGKILGNDQNTIVNKAIEAILKGNNEKENLNRWFVIADLLAYLGEDDHE